jgi:hypothetical protein
MTEDEDDFFRWDYFPWGDEEWIEFSKSPSAKFRFMTRSLQRGAAA